MPRKNFCLFMKNYRIKAIILTKRPNKSKLTLLLAPDVKTTFWQAHFYK